MAASVADFIQLFTNAVEKNSLVKLTLGGKKEKQSDLKNVFVKAVVLKTGNKLSFVYRHTTNDITKNFSTAEAVAAINILLQKNFYNADLFTVENHFQLLQQGNKTKIITQSAPLQQAVNQQHDRQKQRLITASGNIYLQQLGVTNQQGMVKKEMQDKYKQINRYTEIIEGIVKDASLGNIIRVTDMGSGKGYLTFALYDYLTNTLHRNAEVTGVEIRPDLIDTCNRIAAKAGFSNLQFKNGSIAETDIAGTDVLIALHACDTATDDAIYKGIQAGSKVIVVAPCCHKQIRKQMKPENVLSTITRHGILLERQAEMVTDSIRALLLEAAGYSTKVFEFIDAVHTPKNVMIAGVKSNTNANKKEILEKVAALKSMFNIREHYLEKLLQSVSI